MDENKQTPTNNQPPAGQSAMPISPAPQNEAKKPENTPDYPKNDTNNTGDKIDIRSIVRIIIIILIIGLGIWFFNRGSKPTNNSEQNTTNTLTNNTEQPGENTLENQKENNFGVSSTEKTKITAYYSKAGDANCSTVYPLEREIEKKYDQEIVNAIRGLLTPLASLEKTAGYITNIPNNVYLNNIFVAGNGTVTIRLNDALKKITGSCAISAARAQIENTLKQFSYVKSVIICIADNCNQTEILQP